MNNKWVFNSMENIVIFFYTASVIPTALKPLIINSLCPCTYLYISKIHLACSGLTWDKFNETSTSVGSLPSLSCQVTSPVYHMLYFSRMNLFAGLLKVISNVLHTLNNNSSGNIQNYYWLGYEVQCEDTVIFTTDLSYLFIISPFKSVHYSKTRLPVWVTLSLTYISEV